MCVKRWALAGYTLLVSRGSDGSLLDADDHVCDVLDDKDQTVAQYEEDGVSGKVQEKGTAAPGRAAPPAPSTLQSASPRNKASMTSSLLTGDLHSRVWVG